MPNDEPMESSTAGSRLDITPKRNDIQICLITCWPNPMRRKWIIVVVLIVLAVVWRVAFTGTPLFGRRIALKDTPVTSIELSMSMRHEITGSNLRSQVLQTIRKARDG